MNATRHFPGRISNPWGARTPYGPGQPWPVRVDHHLADGVAVADVEAWVPSAAVLHSNGDGLDIAVKDGAIVGVRGRADDRVNHGRLDPKDLYGWQANNSPDRLTTPPVRVDGRLVECGWDEAMGRVAAHSKRLVADHGPDALGFYTSGQLFCEAYYTLAAIVHGAIGTNHLDGNTRLCTATAAAALKESFGADGQPGSYSDVDHADVIALFGHNVAETQVVLWTRMLDRLAGPNPPAIVCVDPRETPVARAATVHLAPLPGTNVALMNGLLREVIANDWIDRAYITGHTRGFDDLVNRVEPYTPDTTARICGLSAEWANEEHVADLARLWNLDVRHIPHGGPPTHAMKMLDLAEEGELRMLWVSATNPAVSLPDLARVRGILRRESLFPVVQDIFRTETAELADVVLPAAAWGEKTGVFTNADRTVHLSRKAVEPPGQARSDVDIFLDYARRMDLRDRSGAPFPPWRDGESAYRAWQAASAGRPCDYTGLSYDLLEERGGVQWPRDTDNPDGTERLYRDGRFPTEPDYCETYGHDLMTGDPVDEAAYRANDPAGRALIKSADYTTAPEPPTTRLP
ncbi:molybdopterin-dependent oxidoreductase-like protein [Actinokineospora auranticolor]|uniref:Molybdopterin-dependent oxidoreductase-like protein n=1 Tax=Actinokineospora auranticolor TaxID=155976 RepID=A0A2S6GN28_9PSEU|nr:molybdopterin-dependent oxidoreductase-like protein [Actinokineospora auranticolor]